MAHWPTNVMKWVLSGTSERSQQQDPLGSFMSYEGLRALRTH